MLSALLTMDRYVKDKMVKEEFLFCKPLQTKAFKLKLSRWSSRIAKDNLGNLPSLNRIAKNCLLQNVKHDIIAHLMMLGTSFDGYFSAGKLNLDHKSISI